MATWNWVRHGPHEVPPSDCGCRPSDRWIEMLPVTNSRVAGDFHWAKDFPGSRDSPQGSQGARSCSNPWNPWNPFGSQSDPKKCGGSRSNFLLSQMLSRLFSVQKLFFSECSKDFFEPSSALEKISGFERIWCPFASIFRRFQPVFWRSTSFPPMLETTALCLDIGTWCHETGLPMGKVCTSMGNAWNAWNWGDNLAIWHTMTIILHNMHIWYYCIFIWYYCIVTWYLTIHANTLAQFIHVHPSSLRPIGYHLFDKVW